MAAEVPVTEGEIPFNVPDAGKPCSTFYKILGDLKASNGPVLIALHGGPGSGHNYLTPLGDLYAAPYNIPTLLYDQIGCGKSTHLREKKGDEAFWSFDLFISELNNLIDNLGIRERGFYLFGTSWGAVLAAEYAMRQPSDTPSGLKKLILQGGPASIPLFEQGLKGLLAKLPPDVRQTLEECDRRGDHESEEFQKAAKVFTTKHVCSLDPPPEEIRASFKNIKDDSTVYLTIQGPAEFIIVGSIRGYEGWKRAHNIKVETLLLNGEHDEVADIAVYPWFRSIPKVRWVTFPGATHVSHWEVRDKFIQEVGGFLVDTTPGDRKEL